MPESFDVTEFKATIAKLAEANDLAESRRAYRDRQLLLALDEGYKWRELQALTGLTARGLAKAIQRARQA